MKKRLAEFFLYLIVFGFAALVVQLVEHMADLSADLDYEAERLEKRQDRDNAALWRAIAKLQEPAEADAPAAQPRKARQARNAPAATE